MSRPNRFSTSLAATRSAANDSRVGLIIPSALPDWRDDPTVTMDLEGVAASASALLAVDRLYGLFGGSKLAPQSRDRFRMAIGAVLFDLLRAASFDPIRRCYRPMSAKSFTGLGVGYHAAERALRAFQDSGLVERLGGDHDRVTKLGTITRFAPTNLLLDSLSGFGITPDNRDDHFKRRPIAKRADQLVSLKSGKKRKDGKRLSGKILPIDLTHPIVVGRIAALQRINAFMGDQVIGGADHSYFHCIFNQGDRPGHGYQKGGRIWPASGGYQNIEKAKRRDITLNGDPTVELDISSSHLTIFLAKLGVRFDPTVDQYIIPGIPRDVVKLMVNLTLSQRWALNRWPADIVKEFAEEHSINLIDDFPYDIIRERVLDHHPILKDRFSIYMDWGDLQFIESEALIRTVDRLAKAGVPSLPVHDSIIVPVKDRAFATYILSRSFEEVVGVTLYIKASKLVG